MRSMLMVLIVILLAVAARVAAMVIPAAGYLRTIEEVDIAQCRRIDVAPGTEDVEIDAGLEVAFVAASERRTWYHANAPQLTAKNGIYAVALDGSDQVRRVSPQGMALFAHGISLWRGDGGEKRLFAVNHLPQGDGSVKEIVEIFRVETDATLAHLKSVSFPEMYSPNDVVAVGPESFYATNDRRYDEGPMAVAEIYLGLSLSGVVYWDGSSGRDVAGGLMYANGINTSTDAAKVYVAEVLGQRVQVFDRDPATGDLSRDTVIPVDTGPDNLSVDAAGRLYAAGHPYALEFQKHAEDPSHISASQVVAIDPSSGATETIFYAERGQINGASVGAVWGKTLVVGAVFDGHVLVCPRP